MTRTTKGYAFSKMRLIITLPVLLAVVIPLSAQAYISLCRGTRQVVNCEFQEGNTNCFQFYEGWGCRAVNCRPGYNNRCRASHTPVKTYCLQPFYPREYCELGQ
ncbi:MAG: hypothetical protein H0U75_13785 [Legionella sp.]|nr:hypothetical protein [Legionella sp.]